MSHYAIMLHSRYLFRYPSTAPIEQLRLALNYSKSIYGDDVTLELHTPANVGLQVQTLNI